MIILKSKHFVRFMKDTGIGDADLREAVRQAEKGLIDADLGGGLLKQRIARPNQGKSGGFRTILVFRAADRSVFIYGFAKNNRANIRPDELKALKALAAELLSYDKAQLDQAIRKGALVEVSEDE